MKDVREHDRRLQLFRTGMIDTSVWIEDILENVISFIITKDVGKKSEFVKSLLFDKSFFQFERKIKLAKILMEKYHKPILKKYPDFFDDCIKIKDARNIVSHNRLQQKGEVYENDIKNKRYTFVYWEGYTEKKKIISYNEFARLIKIASKNAGVSQLVWLLVKKRIRKSKT